MSSDPALPVSPDRMTDVPPHARRMLDRYEIIAEIAKGGMGTVYLARLEGAGGFERLMALKLMHEHLADDEQFVTMLLDEARTAANIHHPNAVGIVDVCESKVGYYLVMNYVDGFSLWQVMTHPDLSERDRIRLCTRLIADSLHGLHAAHTAKNAKGEKLGIVHRDVSPQNVLVGTDGLGRIVDFGIALAASRVASSRPGVLKGKPSYMAPEQARGDVCDARTDVFSMGIVLWEALMNERLFWAEVDVAVLVQVMDCHVERPDARNPAIPAALADVVMRALARSPADRFASARDFAIALEQAAGAVGLLASTPEVEERLAEIFASDIADKQAAVAGHLSASAGSPVALRRGELGTIPRLLVRKPTSRDMPTRGSHASGIRSRESNATQAEAPTSKASQPRVAAVPSTPAVIVEEVPVAPPSSRPSRPAPSPQRLGVALAALGVLLALAAAAVLLASRDTVAPTEPSGVAAEPSGVAAEPSGVAAEPSGVAAEPSGVAAEPSEATNTEQTPVHAAEAPASPVEAPPLPTERVELPPAAPTERSESHHHRDRAHPAATARESLPTAPPAPALEANPYLTH